VDDVWRSLPNASASTLIKYDYVRVFIGPGRNSVRPSTYLLFAGRLPSRRAAAMALASRGVVAVTASVVKGGLRLVSSVT